jgi:glycosyltransferase involved in cell wall biosynthesis
LSQAPLMLSVFATFAVGGQQVRFIALANHYGTRFRHAIIAMDGCVEAGARLQVEAAYPQVEIRKGDLLGNVRRFRRVLRELRPDVLVTHSWGSIEWGVANLIPLARHVHVEDGFGPEERDRQLPRRVWMRRLALRRAELGVPSRTLERIATGVWKLDPKRVHYIPNGLDLTAFGGARAPHDVPVVGTVAALRVEKNLPRLLRAFALATKDRAGRLVIVGDGPVRGALEALAGELGISERVTFAGYVAAPAGLYAGFDVVALSSDTEQMPMCVLEGMAAGLPVVSTDVGDIRAMVSGENAPFLVGRDDAEMAGALGRLLDDAGLRRRVGAANRVKAEAEYDQGAMFAAWEKLFLGESA